MPRWDAAQYLKFGNERTQPAIDLLRRVEVDAPSRIMDLGCGPGNSTVSQIVFCGVSVEPHLGQAGMPVYLSGHLPRYDALQVGR
jgi:hypothetical protein